MLGRRLRVYASAQRGIPKNVAHAHTRRCLPFRLHPSLFFKGGVVVAFTHPEKRKKREDTRDGIKMKR